MTTGNFNEEETVLHTGINPNWQGFIPYHPANIREASASEVTKIPPPIDYTKLDIDRIEDPYVKKLAATKKRYSLGQAQKNPVFLPCSGQIISFTGQLYSPIQSYSGVVVSHWTPYITT